MSLAKFKNVTNGLNVSTFYEYRILVQLRTAEIAVKLSKMTQNDKDEGNTAINTVYYMPQKRVDEEVYLPVAKTNLCINQNANWGGELIL